MDFTIDYARDVTIVKSPRWGTLTIILRDSVVGDLISIDPYCDHSPERTEDPYTAIKSALFRAQYCVKDAFGAHITEECGDKAGFYRPGEDSLVGITKHIFQEG